LGIGKFMVLGFCIGGPFIWRMLQRAPQRVIAAVPAMPSGFRPEVPDLFYRNNMKNWAPPLCEKRRDVTIETCSAFLKKMYHENNDFVFSVTRDFVRGCTTPVLVMPDDTEPHPYAVAEETALLAPNAQMTFFPWKEAKDRVPLAVRHLRTFLKANMPT
jgi:pimeloyl-ACP methyl ester carboxylesterase